MEDDYTTNSHYLTCIWRENVLFELNRAFTGVSTASPLSLQRQVSGQQAVAKCGQIFHSPHRGLPILRPGARENTKWVIWTPHSCNCIFICSRLLSHKIVDKMWLFQLKALRFVAAFGNSWKSCGFAPIQSGVLPYISCMRRDHYIFVARSAESWILSSSTFHVRVIASWTITAQVSFSDHTYLAGWYSTNVTTAALWTDIKARIVHHEGHLVIGRSLSTAYYEDAPLARLHGQINVEHCRHWSCVRASSVHYRTAKYLLRWSRVWCGSYLWRR